jgi:hypothetical protein
MYSKDGIIVKKATSLFWTVTGPGFEVAFDKNDRVYIRLSPEYGGKVKTVLQSFKWCFFSLLQNP